MTLKGKERAAWIMVRDMLEMREDERKPGIFEPRKETKEKEVYREGLGTGSAKDGKAGKNEDNRKRMTRGSEATWKKTNLVGCKKHHSGMERMERAEKMRESNRGWKSDQKKFGETGEIKGRST